MEIGTAVIAPEVEPVPNLPLLRKVLDHIDAHPEEWNQADFVTEGACRTTYCIAGHAVAMTVGVVTLDGVIWPAGDNLDWEDVAADALGLTPAESFDLFYGFKDPADREGTRAQVQGVAERIAERAGERL